MKLLNRIINNLYYFILLLVPLGWFLNGKYYFSRFTSEGFGEWLSLIIAVTLVIFASIIFSSSQLLKKKDKKVWILLFGIYCILAIYSINCTTAGQYWDQQVKNKQFNTEKAEKENESFLLQEYQDKLKSLQKEYDKINSRIDNTIENLDDMWNYKNTNQKAEDLKKEIKNEIKIYEKKIEDILKENKISVKEKDNITMSKTLYIFYSAAFNMRGENPHEKVQFVFQLLLSIIIEMIAQISIFIFLNVRPEEKKKIEKKIEIFASELRNFALIAWNGIKRGQSRYLTGKSVLFRNMTRHCPYFTEQKYKMIMSKAIEKHLIKKDRKYGFLPASEFVDQEFFLKKMKEYFKIT